MIAFVDATGNLMNISIRRLSPSTFSSQTTIEIFSFSEKFLFKNG